MKFKAVLFDFDGTLTKPGALDFSVIKKTIGCPADQPVLEFIEGLADPDQQEKARAILERFEISAAMNSEPNPGAEELILYLRSNNLRIGIISRNSLQSIHQTLKNFKHIGSADFDLIISRDEPVKPKPSGDGILLAAKKMRVDVSSLLMVGDYVFDVQSGKSAGAVTVFLDNRPESQSKTIDSDYSDYVISELEELKKIVRSGVTTSGS